VCCYRRGRRRCSRTRGAAHERQCVAALDCRPAARAPGAGCVDRTRVGQVNGGLGGASKLAGRRAPPNESGVWHTQSAKAGRSGASRQWITRAGSIPGDRRSRHAVIETIFLLWRGANCPLTLPRGCSYLVLGDARLRYRQIDARTPGSQTLPASEKLRASSSLMPQDFHGIVPRPPFAR
jgi:hypothetical protein